MKRIKLTWFVKIWQVATGITVVAIIHAHYISIIIIYGCTLWLLLRLNSVLLDLVSTSKTEFVALVLPNQRASILRKHKIIDSHFIFIDVIPSHCRILKVLSIVKALICWKNSILHDLYISLVHIPPLKLPRPIILYPINRMLKQITLSIALVLVCQCIPVVLVKWFALHYKCAIVIRFDSSDCNIYELMLIRRSPPLIIRLVIKITILAAHLVGLS